MTRLTAWSAAVFCTSFLLPAGSTASVIFTNFGPGNAYDITQGNIVGDDFVGDNLAEADTFTPLATATFGSLEVALSCVIVSCPDSYTVSLTQDSGTDSPGLVIESFTGSGSSLGQLNVNNAPVTFNSLLMPLLTGGVQYWVTVSSSLNNSIAWNLRSTTDSSDQALSPDAGASWFVLGNEPGAYEVDSSVSGVPEPGTFGLLAAPALAFLIRKRLSMASSSPKP